LTRGGGGGGWGGGWGGGGVGGGGTREGGICRSARWPGGRALAPPPTPPPI
jgi:hypothetical protein